MRSSSCSVQGGKVYLKKASVFGLNSDAPAALHRELSTPTKFASGLPQVLHESIKKSRTGVTRMRKVLAASLVTCSMLAVAGCGSTEDGASEATASAGPGLGIRPAGDTELQIDMSKVQNDELAQVFAYIDENIDEHVVNLQKWIQQPSISNTGEGIPESAEMVKGFFDQLGCQKTQVYDVGQTEYGSQANPVVYAHCDEGAEKTLVLYWMYDTMPVSQPDLWKAPPFEAQIVEQAPYKKVLIGRGATNSKGPQMAMWNALMSIKAVTGKLPVNLIFVAEGDEERMSIGYRKFVREHPELFADADAMYRFDSQAAGGGGGVSGGSEGSVFVELTTSGEKWGKGPNYSDIHGGFKRSVDAPAWRHIKMLATLTDETGNRVAIDGFYDNMEPLSAADEARLRQSAEGYDLAAAAENLGVERFISEQPYEVLRMSRYGTSMNIDGIWGGNMFPGGSGAILPNKITSKHNFRYIPNMDGTDIVNKLRAHLDKHGFPDVEINVVGDVPWAKRSSDNELGRAVVAMYDVFGIPHGQLSADESIFGGYWPAYLFAGDTLDIPIIGGMAGHGGNAHAANEYYVIEGAGKVYGMAGAEKSVAMVLYNYAGLNGPVAPAAAK